MYTSLRANERPHRQQGDAIAGRVDMRLEQLAAFQRPGTPDPRVIRSEANQGRLD